MPHHRRWCSFVNQAARWRSDRRPRSGLALMSTALFPYLVAGLAGALLAITAGAIACGRVHAKVRRLTDALDHMSQGLCMFDAAGRIGVCNRPYLRMYKLSPDW